MAALTSRPAPPDALLVRWTGPMRRVKKFLRAAGWQVNRAERPFPGWHLVALHPLHGVKLLWVYAPRGPDPDLAALADFACDPAWVKEVWRYPATWGPRIVRMDGCLPAATATAGGDPVTEGT